MRRARVAAARRPLRSPAAVAPSLRASAARSRRSPRRAPRVRPAPAGCRRAAPAAAERSPRLPPRRPAGAIAPADPRGSGTRPGARARPRARTPAGRGATRMGPRRTRAASRRQVPLGVAQSVRCRRPPLVTTISAWCGATEGSAITTSAKGLRPTTRVRSVALSGAALLGPGHRATAGPRCRLAGCRPARPLGLRRDRDAVAGVAGDRVALDAARGCPRAPARHARRWPRSYCRRSEEVAPSARITPERPLRRSVLPSIRPRPRS